MCQKNGTEFLSVVQSEFVILYTVIDVPAGSKFIDGFIKAFGQAYVNLVTFIFGEAAVRDRYSSAV